MSLSQFDRSMDSHGLREPQRRHVAVFLQQVDEALDEIEGLAAKTTPETKLFRMDINDLPVEFGEAIRPTE